MAVPRLLGVAGSLRAGSFNRRLLEAATEELANADWTIARLRAIPPYDADVEALGLPSAVALFKNQIADADAVVIATPEYNRSIPGVLKNAIDWASRPPGRSPFIGKPVLIIGASTGRGGARRAMDHLRQVLNFLDPLVLPEVVSVALARERFNDGRLDAEIRRELRSSLVDLVSKVDRPARANEAAATG